MSLRTVSTLVLLIPTGLMAYSIGLSTIHQTTGRTHVSYETEASSQDFLPSPGSYAPLPSADAIKGPLRPDTQVVVRKSGVSAKATVPFRRPGTIVNPTALDKVSWRVRGF